MPENRAVTLDEILKMALAKEASDVHLKAGVVPIIRRHGELVPLSSQLAPMSEAELEQMAYSLMDNHQHDHFDKNKDIDLSYGINGLGRFRINILRQRGSVRMVIRNIPDNVSSLDELQLPPVLKDIAHAERGLVLVTGATGSGKSSTLAAMIDYINRNKSLHILMIEDPTEYLIRDKKSIITQRELGSDTISFASSLRAALRQDPDVILIGEMRDRETIEIALLAAETGHLVLSTLHTLDATETINRILAAFEPHQQLQIRMQLAAVLKSVISQRLCLNKQGTGYVPALEILMNNSRVAECIADPHLTPILKTVIEESKHSWKMQSFDQSLMDLVRANKISYEEALKNSTSPENFAIRYSGISHTDGGKWDVDTDVKKAQKKSWQDLSVVDLETEVRKSKKSKNGKKESDNLPPTPGSNKTATAYDLIKLLKKIKG